MGDRDNAENAKRTCRRLVDFMVTFNPKHFILNVTMKITVYK